MPRRDAVDAAARESPRLANEHDGIKSNAGNGESMVVTTESLLNDKKNIAADSYEKVLLPRVRSTTIRVTPSIAKGDLLKRAAQRTEVHYRKLPKHLDWKECLVNVRSAPLTLPDLRNAADGTNDLGCSCVGVVETVGPGTSLLKESDWVVPLSDTMGTFSSLRVWDEKDLLKIERDVMPVEYAALWRELALAYHLLETEASELKAGDAVLISAANGAVGQILIQLCRLVKLRTLCIVRKSDAFEDTKAWLEFLGAARVFCYEDVVADELKREHSSLPKLAFDGVGGSSSLVLAEALAPGGSVVTYGSLAPVRGDWSVLARNRITVSGFSLLSWLKEDRKNRDKLKTILTQVAKLVNAQKLRVSTTDAPLHAFHRALSSLEPNTKVVFAMPSLQEELTREAARKQSMRREKELQRERALALDAAASRLFASPSSSSKVDQVLVIDCPSPTSTLIWCHGNGELAQEYAPMFRKVFSPMNVKVVMPAPPTSSDSQKWFDLEDLSWSKVIGGSCATEADLSVLEQIDAGAAKVAALVEQEANGVYVSGFAQGGCVALYAALCRARTAGAMSLGGPPVRVEVLKAKARFPTTPVRLLCGSDDEAFSVQSCESVVGGLSEIVPDARLEVVAGGRHDVSLTEVEALAAAVKACAKPSQ